MTEDLMEAGGETVTPDDTARVDTDAGMTAGALRPPSVPEKFWDAETGETRVEAMAKSYAELERKLGGYAGRDVPDDPGAYEIKADDGMVSPDPTVNARLHEAGFSQAQAQVVYDLANEYVPGMVRDIAAEFEARGQIERLAQHFGGAEKWQETARQIAAWGKETLPPDVYRALAGTYEGVLTLERMMVNGEPGLVRQTGAGTGETSEADLKQMMRDPRYWRDHDPAFVDKVRTGFKRMFPDKG